MIGVGHGWWSNSCGTVAETKEVSRAVKLYLHPHHPKHSVVLNLWARVGARN